MLGRQILDFSGRHAEVSESITSLTAAIDESRVSLVDDETPFGRH